MKEYKTEKLRNIALVSHGGADELNRAIRGVTWISR